MSQWEVVIQLYCIVLGHHRPIMHDIQCDTEMCLFRSQISSEHCWLLTRSLLSLVVYLFCCQQVPPTIRQAYLRNPGARCDFDIPCEPVRRRIPVVTACFDDRNSRRISWMTTSQIITVGFTCARRNKQQQWRTVCPHSTDWQQQKHTLPGYSLYVIRLNYRPVF